jgi:hypothetical protein
VSVELFRDDDQGYVLNIQRTLNPSDARVHHADCRTITGTPPRGRTWTGPYVKACSLSLPELDAWALAQAGSAITRCGTCRWLPRAAIRQPASAQSAENPCRRHGQMRSIAPNIRLRNCCEPVLRLASRSSVPAWPLVTSGLEVELSPAASQAPDLRRNTLPARANGDFTAYSPEVSTSAEFHPSPTKGIGRVGVTNDMRPAIVGTLIPAFLGTWCEFGPDGRKAQPCSSIRSSVTCRAAP